MKTIALLTTFTLSFSLQTGFNASDFGTKFKSLFALAKTYYKNEKLGTGRAITDANFVKEYDCATHFDGALVSRIVEDHENVCQHQVHYNAGTDKEAAIKLFNEVKATVVASLPQKYKATTTYDTRYFDSQAHIFEYDSDVFAQVATRPSAKMGVILIDGTYRVEVLILENIFR